MVSISVFLHALAIFLNPMPGSHAGRFLTGRCQQPNLAQDKHCQDILRKGTVSTIHFPGAAAKEKSSIASLTSVTRGSLPCGSMLYPYAIFRMTAPASLIPPINILHRKIFRREESNLRPKMLDQVMRLIQHPQQEPPYLNVLQRIEARSKRLGPKRLVDRFAVCAEPVRVRLHSDGVIPADPVALVSLAFLLARQSWCLRTFLQQMSCGAATS